MASRVQVQVQVEVQVLVLVLAEVQKSPGLNSLPGSIPGLFAEPRWSPWKHRRLKFSWKTDSGVLPPRLCPPSTCQVLDLEGTCGGPMSNQVFSVVFGVFFFFLILSQF